MGGGIRELALLCCWPAHLASLSKGLLLQGCGPTHSPAAQISCASLLHLGPVTLAQPLPAYFSIQNSPIHQFGHLNLLLSLRGRASRASTSRESRAAFTCSFLPPAKSTRGREQTTVTSVLRNLVWYCIYLGCQYKNGVRILSFARPRACVTGL